MYGMMILQFDAYIECSGIEGNNAFYQEPNCVAIFKAALNRQGGGSKINHQHQIDIYLNWWGKGWNFFSFLI